MTKSIRKYKGWLMAGFMILLMLAWLGAPATSGIGEIRKNRTVGSVDGRKITAEDHAMAAREIDAFSRLLPGIVEGVLGIQDKDPTHWLLMWHEARAGGYVGEAGDGEDYATTLARELIQSDPRLRMQLQFQKIETLEKAAEYVAPQVRGAFRDMNEEERDLALAKFRGVIRMLQAYRTAPHLSDRAAAERAKLDMDAAVVDEVFIGAELSADQVADPDDAALTSHFDKFKGTKPGEGDYGIGYLLARRVKIEWITLSKEAFERAAELDPIEVNKRYKQNNPGKYPGAFSVERANVEKDMRAEVAEKAMHDANVVVQAEILKATRPLANDGATKYKVLPENWEAARPRMETIAQAVAAEAKKSGLNLGLPEVTVKGGTWLTDDDLRGLPGIGLSALRQGSLFKSFTEVVAWTRELNPDEPGVFPVQVGVPVSESYLFDQQGNRYYFTVLAVRGESAPDSVAEIREKAVEDFKRLAAFERLKARLDEFRAAGISGGLDAVVTAATPSKPILSDPAKKDEGKPEVRKAVRITRKSAGDVRIDEEPVRKAVVEAAAALDPMTPFGKLDAERATLALAAPRSLGVVVMQIQSYNPLTREAFRRADPSVVLGIQRELLTTTPGSERDPFSLPSLLKRHDYVSGSEHIRNVEQLKQRDKSEG